MIGCGGNFEGSCKSLCDKVAECSDEIVPPEDVLECKRECEDTELEGQRRIADGELSQECYNASADLLDCGAGLSCAELRSSDTPPQCQEVLDRVDQVCDS